MSSIASHLSATAAAAAMQWQQNLATTPETAAAPFAALLDAATSAADTTNAAATPQQTGQQPAAAEAAATVGNTPKGLSGGSLSEPMIARNGPNSTKLAAIRTRNAAATPTGSAASSTTTAATAAAAGSGTAADGNGAIATSGVNRSLGAQDDLTATANSPAEADGPNGVDTTDAARVTASGSSLPNAFGAATNSADDGPQNADGGDTADPGHAAPAQSATNAPQPVAAAIGVDGAVNSVPTSSNGPASDATIGDSIKTHARPAWPAAGESNTPATQGGMTKAQAAGPVHGTDGKTVTAGQSGSPANPSSTAAPNSSTAQDQSQADNAALPAQPNATAVADQATPRTGVFGASALSDSPGSSAAQAGSSNAQANAAVANFGFSAASAATPAATVVTSAAAASVPIAGLAVTIAARAQAGSNQFDIRLDPPELGRIDVRLDVDRDGRVSSHVTVDRADTLQLLQSQQPQLERALEQAGLKTADNGLQFTLRDQSFAGGNNGDGAQSGAAQLVIPDADQSPIQATQAYSRFGLRGGIDIRV